MSASAPAQSEYSVQAITASRDCWIVPRAAAFRGSPAGRSLTCSRRHSRSCRDPDQDRDGQLGRLGLEPAQRPERERPGGLVHIDVKKPRRLQVLGHRISGNRRVGRAGITSVTPKRAAPPVERTILSPRPQGAHRSPQRASQPYRYLHLAGRVGAPRVHEQRAARAAREVVRCASGEQTTGRAAVSRAYDQ